MANSEYEYVKEFEFDRRLPASNWIVLRIDGCHFHRFAEVYDFEKPNDERALRLMYACATSMLAKFSDMVFAYGVSDEYSFVFKQETEFHNRRESKILTECVTFFTAMYVMKWKSFFPSTELRESDPPYFDGRVVCYPNLKTIRDYMAWRQVDCHINNQYNTCFWMLVKSGKTEKDAQQTLKGTSSKDKNELLLQEFQINYDDEPAIFRKGSSVYREVETKVKTDDHGNPITRIRNVVTVANIDIIGPQFWEKHPYILHEVGTKKCGYDLVKKFDMNHRLPPCNWIIVRINACQFDQFSLIHTLDKPNDEATLRLMNASASLVMERFPDIIFGYGFSNEYNFVFHEKTELYQRQPSLILSSCSSYFTCVYTRKEISHKEDSFQQTHFEAEILCCPKPEIVFDYLSGRQAECHRSNQYNTCFWMLVKSGKNKNEAHEILKGTCSKDKNELLFQQFQMNYNNEPAMFRKGSCAYRQKVEELAEAEDGEHVKRERWDLTVAHVDMKPEFWRKHPHIFNKSHLVSSVLPDAVALEPEATTPT